MSRLRVAAALLLLWIPIPSLAAVDEPEDEMAEVLAAEEQALSDGTLDLEQALSRLGAANPWRASIRAALGLDRGAWPHGSADPMGSLSLAGAGELPFALDSVAARYDIPVAFNDAVAEYLAFFQGPGRRFFTRWMERSGRYVPLFREILRSHDVPEDLVYLSMIESGFSMNARSWAAAVGPWQFIPGTGKMYGLKADFWVDERQDFEKSTHAAARFLKRLHESWGDWYLAWAGYNGGPGRVKRAIDTHGTTDFWELTRAEGAFAKETRHYVPKLIAAALIAKHPEHFGFDTIELERPLAWEVVEIADATDLAVIARCAGVSVDELKTLNPELKRWATPPVSRGEEPYRLRIPKGTTERFAENFAKVPASERFTFRGYQVQPGDTLGHIALMFDTNVDAIMRTNHIQNARALRVGQELIIPVPPGAMPRQPPTRQVRATGTGPRTTTRTGVSAPASRGTHVLKEGETLGHVALKYGCTVEQLKRWNGIRDVRKVRVGQTLRVR